MWKGKDSDPDPYLWLMDPAQKMWILRIRIPNTALEYRVPQHVLYIGNQILSWFWIRTESMQLVFSLESCKNIQYLGVPYRQCGRCGHPREGGLQPRGHRRQYTAQVYYGKNIFSTISKNCLKSERDILFTGQLSWDWLLWGTCLQFSVNCVKSVPRKFCNIDLVLIFVNSKICYEEFMKKFEKIIC